MPVQKLTPQLQKSICDAIAAGNYIETACQLNSIHKTSYYDWKRKGEKQKQGIYRDFLEATNKAEAAAEVAAIGHIKKAYIDGEWQAAAWYLERKYPDKWGRKDRMTLAGDKAEPLEVNVTLETPEQRLARYKTYFENPDESNRKSVAISGRDGTGQ